MSSQNLKYDCTQCPIKCDRFFPLNKMDGLERQRSKTTFQSLSIMKQFFLKQRCTDSKIHERDTHVVPTLGTLWHPVKLCKRSTRVHRAPPGWGEQRAMANLWVATQPYPWLREPRGQPAAEPTVPLRWARWGESGGGCSPRVLPSPNPLGGSTDFPWNSRCPGILRSRLGGEKIIAPRLPPSPKRAGGCDGCDGRQTISESSRGILANKHRHLRLTSCKSALIVSGIQLLLQKLSKSKQIRSRRGGETGEKPSGPYLHIVSLRLYSLACRCICRILVCFGISHRYDSHL